ncbi:hypothetical protein EMPS_05659 [Entomortierella parvispora]|uniref:Nuclear rim protein 1 n=1 Tax=Entomortierella parvispora TaxID=205924 RepID=A0A9P3LWI7_9FUNG|nr:hypothetical protein EMPS_05659 [Entomortierella parvispora]
MDTNRRPRVVRKAGWLTRIRNAPEDYITRIENDMRALDWDKIQEGVSWPLAVGLNLLFASVKLGYWLDDPLGNVPAVLKHDRSLYSSSSMTPAFHSLLLFLQIILISISLGNALWLFSSKKNYKMMHRDPKQPPSSSNVKLVEFIQTRLHWSFRFPGRCIYPFIPSFLVGPKPEQRNLQVWEMALWNPSILSRNIFCWFSPAQVLILTVMDADSFYVFAPLSIAVAAQVHFVVSVYQAHIKDKQILFEEVYREYNNKFVHPRIFVRKYDKAISTETDTNDLILETYRDDGTVHCQPAQKLSQYQVMTIPKVPNQNNSSIQRAPLAAMVSRSPSVSSGTDDDSDEEEDPEVEYPEDQYSEEEDPEEDDAGDVQEEGLLSESEVESEE